ncbi:MAG: hypothetical protein H6621_07225 [Halobacteriovoraceae bacterium]|nr:hypothetical protein [Halobacteriovoraceae bacterium]
MKVISFILLCTLFASCKNSENNNGNDRYVASATTTKKSLEFEAETCEYLSSYTKNSHNELISLDEFKTSCEDALNAKGEYLKRFIKAKIVTKSNEYLSDEFYSSPEGSPITYRLIEYRCDFCGINVHQRLCYAVQSGLADINKDGDFSTLDLLKFQSGEVTHENNGLDINGDNFIGQADLEYLRDYLLGKYDCEEYPIDG